MNNITLMNKKPQVVAIVQNILHLVTVLPVYHLTKLTHNDKYVFNKNDIIIITLSILNLLGEFIADKLSIVVIFLVNVNDYYF